MPLPNADESGPVAPDVPVVTTTRTAEIAAAVTDHGAVVIRRRGTGVTDFIDLAERLTTPMAHHATASENRDALDEFGHTATVECGSHAIPLHRELGYFPGAPEILLFHCVAPAREGGQTTLCNGEQLLATLRDRALDLASNAVLDWQVTFPPERWSLTLGVQRRGDAVERLEQLSSTLPANERLEFEFSNNTLTTRYRTQCVIPTRNGGHAFCNSLLVHVLLDLPSRATARSSAGLAHLLELVNREDFDYQTVHSFAQLAEAQTYEIEWQAGDIAVIDNGRWMHGRRSFVGARRILARIGHGTRLLWPT